MTKKKDNDVSEAARLLSRKAHSSMTPEQRKARSLKANAIKREKTKKINTVDKSS